MDLAHTMVTSAHAPHTCDRPGLERSGQENGIENGLFRFRTHLRGLLRVPPPLEEILPWRNRLRNSKRVADRERSDVACAGRRIREVRPVCRRATRARVDIAGGVGGVRSLLPAHWDGVHRPRAASLPNHAAAMGRACLSANAPSSVNVIRKRHPQTQRKRREEPGQQPASVCVRLTGVVPSLT
jgi:hypothetical protein